MIYIPFHDKLSFDQTIGLFDRRFYRTICLQPENFSECFGRDIRDVPGLWPRWVRQHLGEFAAMVAIWNGVWKRTDDWVGFTSASQFRKGFDFRFNEAALARVRAGEILCWGNYTFPVSLHQQAEQCHPGLTGVVATLLWDVHRKRMPPGWYVERSGSFCNYFACQWETFDEYMRFASPVVFACLERWGQEQVFHRPGPGYDRAVGYLAERLLPIWLLMRDVGEQK